MSAKRIFGLIIILSLFIITSPSQARSELESFELIEENENLQLYLNDTFVEFAILDKASGDIWFTNPYDRENRETLIRGSSKDRLNSQLRISYYVANSRNTLDSYNDSVAHGQYEITNIPNGVRVDYTLGKQWDDDAYLPQIISEEAFNEILEKLSARDRRFIEDIYIQFQIEEGYVDEDEISIYGVDLDALLEDYGFKIGENLRATDKRRLVQEYLNGITEGQGYSAIGNVTQEDLKGAKESSTMLLKWGLRQWDKEDAIELFREIGYTPQEVIVQHKQYNFMPPQENLRTFEIPVEYVIDGSDFVATIVAEDIKYPNRVWNDQTSEYVSYPLSTISLLGYFGAAEKESEGYIMIPDGSGALIDFEEKGSSVQPYNRYVFGRDLAIAPVAEYSPSLDADIRMPVFGLKQDDKAFLAIIEEGEALSRLEAVTSGMNDSYHHVWATFDYIPRERVYLEAEGALIGLRALSINMYQSRPNFGNMAVRYSFLSEEEADYVGMAKAYQEYLIEHKGLEKMVSPGELPLQIDFVGAIDRVEPVVGIPSNVPIPLTKYEDARSIIEDLMNQGVGDFRVRYKGWLKGGINHLYPRKATLERRVGSKQELADFRGFLESRQIPFYPEVTFTEVHRNSLLNGFVGFRDSSYALNRRQAYVNYYNHATYQAITDQRRPLVSPSSLGSLIRSFSKDYKKHEINGLSISDLGSRLYSDFRTNKAKVVDRQEALNITTTDASSLRALGLDLMVDGGNSYMLPYVSHVSNVPFYSRGEEIINDSIPFYQMVLSGYVPYSAQPANLVNRTGRLYLLKLLETGSIPTFVVSNETSAEVKHTNFNHLYAINYEDLKPSILEMYEETSTILGSLWHQSITDHKRLSQDVFLTEYEDGTKIIVNYGDSIFVYKNTIVRSEGYRVLQ